MDRDRDQRGEGRLLVDRREDARKPRLAREAAGHRQPEADRDRDQRERDDPGGAAGEPPGVLRRGSCSRRRPQPTGELTRNRDLERAGGSSAGPRSSTSPLSWTRKPPLRIRKRRPPLGAGEQRRLGERLRLERGVAERRGADQPGPGGLAGGGIEQVVREPAISRSATTGRSGPRWRSPPRRASRRAPVSPVRGFSTSISNGLRLGSRSRRRGCPLRSRPRSARSRPRRRASRSAARPLPVPPVSKATPGGRWITPLAIVDVDLPPCLVRPRPGRLALRRQGQGILQRGRGEPRRASSRIQPPRARATRVGSTRPPAQLRGVDPGAERPSRSRLDARTLGRGFAFMRAELAVGTEARELRVEALDEALGLDRGMRRVRGIRARFLDDQPDLAAHGRGR